MQKIRKVLPLVFSSIVLAFLFLSFIANLALMEAPLNSYSEGKTDLEGFIDSVEKTYIKNVENKNSYINLNGLYARLIGRHSYNDVVKLNNGMLTYSSLPKRDMLPNARGFSEYNEYLKGQGIKYLYVQAPIKSDMNDELVRVGSENFANQNTNELLENLALYGVDYLDLRETLTSSVELVEKYFYNTDHHWNTDAGFLVYNLLVEELKSAFPNAEFDENALNPSAWTREVYEDWFLGSHGKRVGEYFAGVDDFYVYTPNFETDMSLYIPKYSKLYTGSFEEVNMRTEYLDAPDYFNENPYVTYIGGDYPIVHHVNFNAKNDLKVVIFKDSYTLPVQAFLSTQVKELVVIDPRYYNGHSLAEFADIISPDIVITMINPSSFSSYRYYQTGVARGEYHAAQTAKNEIASLDNITVSANSSQNHRYFNMSDAGVSLKYNTKYTVRIKDLEVLSGIAKGLTLAVYDSASAKFTDSIAFDIKYNEQFGSYEWTFITPESGNGNLNLLIYAGLHGNTAGNTVSFTDVSLIEYK
jgi:hypothetical protein